MAAVICLLAIWKFEKVLWALHQNWVTSVTQKGLGVQAPAENFVHNIGVAEAWRHIYTLRSTVRRPGPSCRICCWANWDLFTFDDNDFIYSKFFGYFCGVILALLMRILAVFKFKLKITKSFAVKRRIFHTFKLRTVQKWN